MHIHRIAQQPPNLSDCGMPRRNPLSTLSYATENSSAELSRFMKSMDFRSRDEANQYLQAAMVYKNGFLLPERPAHIQALIKHDSQSDSARMRDYWTSELAEHYPDIPDRWSKSRKPDSALERAQYCMSDAWEALGEKRAELAKQALELSPDCADAYVLLAQESTTLEEAKVLYEKALEIGSRHLETCPQPINYWNDHKTRPYMRARAGLAATLWQLGQRTDAIDHLFELLVQDSDDHMGNRYQHWHYLLQSKDLEELNGFLEADREISATWYFTRALMLFLKTGTCVQTDQALRDAIRANTHVAQFLLGEKSLPDQMPTYIVPGAVDEAVEYAAWSSFSWSQEAGALKWLRQVREQLVERMKHPSFRVWENSIADANRAIESKQFGKARSHLLYALRQCQRFPADQFLMATYQKLSLACTYLDASTQDEEVFQRTVNLAEELYGEHTSELVFALNGLAVHFLECKKWEKSEEALLRAEAIACEFDDDDLKYTVYVGLARVYEKQGKLDLAREYEKKLEEIASDGEDFDSISSELTSGLPLIRL